MKRTLLFSLMAVLLAGFGFGGISLAQETDQGSTCTDENAVAEFNAIKYCNFINAVNAANGGVITLLKNIDSYSFTGAGIIKIEKGDYKINTIEVPEGYFSEITPAPAFSFGGQPTYSSYASYKIEDAAASIEKSDSITYFSTLNKAIDGAKNKQGTTIKLLSNMNLPIPNGTFLTTLNNSYDFTLDLNGKKVIVSDAARITMNNAKLTITNGTIETTENNSVIFLTVKGGSVLNLSDSFNFVGHGKSNPIYIEGASTLNTSGSITSENNFAIAGNGSNGKGGYKININGGFVGSTNAPAIYHPNSGVLTINGGIIEGSDALYIKAGTTNINGGTLKGNGTKADYTFNGNGANSTADGLVVDSCGYPGGTPNVNINGGTITSTNNRAVGYYIYGENEAPVVDANTNTLSLTDGWSWVPKDGGGYKVGVAYSVIVTSGKVDVSEAAQGATVTITADEAPVGKEFSGWTVNAGGVELADATSATTTFTMGTANVEVEACYKDITYTVRFYSDEIEIADSQTVIYGSTATEPDVDIPWKILLGWFNDDNNKFDFETPVTSNLVLRAQWEDIISVGEAKIDDETDGGTGMVVYAEAPATPTTVATDVQSSNSTATVQGEVELDVYHDADGDGTKEGSKITERVNFTNPVSVKIPVNSGTSVRIKVKHNGESNFGIEGLTKNGAATCTGGVASDSYDGSDVSVTSGYAEIWTCSASTFVAYTEEVKPSSTSNGSSGGGGGSSKTTKADDAKATTGDDATVNETGAEENNGESVGEQKPAMTEAQEVEKFGQEQIDAYKWALENEITTMKTVEAARLDEPLTRAELAKMMVVYIQKVVQKDPILTGDVNYSDVSEELGDLFGYIKLAYQYQIMGINADGTPIELFNPYGIVSRGEYATVFSRVLFGAKFNKEGVDFYTNHLEALKTAGILTNTLPTIQEMRGWVMLMMYRSSQNGEAIEKVANSTEEIVDEAKAEEIVSEETVNASDEEKSEEEINTEETTKDSTEESVSDESSETSVNIPETTGDALSE